MKPKLSEFRIERELLLELTNAGLERNIYVHPNRLARDIFWQRIGEIRRLVSKYAEPTYRLLDVGGGTGVLARTVSPLVSQVTVLDVDAADARSIVHHFDLDNVTIVECDLQQYRPPALFDVVTAADVLEHFSDLTLPIDFIHRVCRPEGLLVISVPTENWLYRVGRLVVRKKKPVDHFHRAADIVQALSRSGLAQIERSSIPKIGLRLPLFEIAAFRKAGG
jgi:2-polyprenyl-3-methyl-5-hydroxy-6-metoxy-1,4-benzoquinol methylase